MCVCAQGKFFYKGNRGVYLNNLRKKFLFKIEKKIQILSRLGEKKNSIVIGNRNEGHLNAIFKKNF